MLTSRVRFSLLPNAIIEFGKVFGAHGFRCYLVGGAVRDMVAGHAATDYDFASNARPEEVMHLFPRVIPTGIKHGTVTVLYRGYELEVTTFRSDGEYGDARHPDEVRYSTSIEVDLARRDFTINALALDVESRELLDPHGGRADLARRVIRAIGDPEARFMEDALRLMRACRFAAQLGFSVEASTKTAMTKCRDRIALVSAERIQEELTKMLSSERPSIGLRLMDETGLLDVVLPELAEGRGVEQKGLHKFDVLDHSIQSCDGAPRGRLDLRLAALLHDIGKPRARAVGPDGLPTFYRHEEFSVQMASAFLKRMRFPNALETRVCHLILHHMFNYDDGWTDAAVRRFVARVGAESIDDLIQLRRADTFGTVGRVVEDRRLVEFRSRIDKVLANDQALSVRDLAVDGNDLAGIGIPRGPAMGRVLGELLETVLDDPSLNDHGRLLEIARRFYEERVKERGDR